MLFRFALLLLFCFAFLIACESDDELVPPPVIATPLELDPEDDYELGEWWTNGTQLLQLEETGYYEIYGSQNQYHDPLERGRWSQRSYAVLKFEPYTELPVDPTRVQIEPAGERIVLRIDDYVPMYMIGAPPRSPEDELFGVWSGDQGDLVLGSNLTYVYVPSRNTDQPITIGRHRGDWELQGEALRFQPDSASVQPFTIEVDRENGEVALTVDESVYHRSDVDLPR